MIITIPTMDFHTYQSSQLINIVRPPMVDEAIQDETARPPMLNEAAVTTIVVIYGMG